MANNKKKKNDEQRVAQINAHKEAAKKISQKPVSTSSSSKPIQVNGAAKKVQQTYGGIPVNTTKSMGSVKKGAAYYRDVAKYTTDSRKWYSGTTPTARETVARIYEVSNGDSARFNELMALYDTERNNRGSAFYNPYAQATNYKEIEALQAAGIDVSGGITAEWFKENQWLRNYARTNTGYGALAPSSKSSDLENAAWAYENLLDAETRTVKAEAELAAMANEAKYWAGLGYSDSEIVKKLKNNSDYGTLWKMDEERQQGGASLLNRAIDYNGDDTMYGMIWAARNEGTGDYFTDSVKYTLGQGNKYKADPLSEAARDPSNLEGYHPYILGGTRHDMNQKYGVTSVDRQWLDDHRDWLNDPEKADDWRAYEKDLEFTQKAETELSALDQWLAGKIEKLDGTEDSYNDLVDELTALITDGGEVSFRDAEGKFQTVKLTNLSKMEDARASGLAENIAYPIDFTLPRYLDKVNDAYEAKAAAAEEVVQPEQKRNYDLSTALNSVPGIIFTGGLGALVPSNLGKENKDFTKSLDKALKGARKSHTNLTDTDYANIYLRSEYGVELAEGAELTEDEAAAVKEFAKQYGESKTVKGSKADKDEAVAALEAMGTAFAGLIADEKRVIAYDPEAKANAAKLAEEEAARIAEEEAAAEAERKENAYKDSAAYATILGADGQKEQQKRQEDAYARGMVEGEFVPQSYTGEAEETPQLMVADQMGNAVPFDSAAYESMLSGDGEWNSELFAQALSLSSDQNAVLGELHNGIADQLMGGEGNALSQSWMRKFKGITGDDTKYQRADHQQLYGDHLDTRNEYGSAVYEALVANKDAIDSGAIAQAEYVDNLISLSIVADSMEAAAGGEAINEELANDVLNANNGALASQVAKVQESCSAAVAEQQAVAAAEEAARIEGIASLRKAYVSGEALDLPAQVELQQIYQTDVSDVARNDNTYQKFVEYFDYDAAYDTTNAQTAWENRSPDGGVYVGPADFMQAYNGSVSLLAESWLTQDMQFAANMNMSLEEYYAAYPEYARTPEQMWQDAANQFDQAWSDYANSDEGLAELAVVLSGLGQADDEEGGATGVGDKIDLTAADIFATATSAFANEFDMALAKSWKFFRYDWWNEEETEARLRTNYSEADLRTAWDEWAKTASEEDKAWYQAMLESSSSIYDLGDPAARKAEEGITEYENVAAYHDQLIEQNGTGVEKFAYKGIKSMENSITLMAGSAIGGFPGSLAAMAPYTYADAYDRLEANGGDKRELVLLSSTAELVLNAYIEQAGFERVMQGRTVNQWANQADHAKYVIQKKGLLQAVKDPKAVQTIIKGLASGPANWAVSAVPEAGEEVAQESVTILAEKAAAGKLPVLEGKDFKRIAEAGEMGYLMGLGFSAAQAGTNSSYAGVDEMQTTISDAESALGPAYEGTLINEAIDFEATVAAIQTSGEQLTALQESPENKAVQQAEEALEAAEQEVTDIDVEIETVTAEQTDAVAAVENANAQIQQSDVCTEEMASQMEAASKALEDAKSKVAALQKKKAAAEAKVSEQRALLDEKRTVVQAKYRQIMDAAKAEAEQRIADKYYNGSTEEQKAASEQYRAACKKLADAKRALQVQKARRKNGIDVQRGRTLLAIDRLTAEVEAAKAEVDEAFANTPESAEEIAQREELEAATQEAQQTAADAEANPADTKKQAAALFSQARLEAIQAKQNLEKTKANVRERLYNKNANVRAQAVAEWQAAQESADAAAQAAQDAEALYNETDTQKQLREAIDEAKQYTNEQLLFDDVEGHADAVAAYNRLELARAMAERDAAADDLGSAEIGTPEYDQALANFNQKAEAVEDVIGRQVGTDGDVIRETFRQKSLGTVAMEAIKNGKQDAAARSIKRILDRELSQAATLMSYSSVEGDNAAIAADLATQLKDDTGNAAQIAEVLNGMEAEMWADHRAAGQSGQQTKAGQNPIEIMRSLTRSIRTGYNPGGNMSIKGKRQNAAVQGMYKAYADAINVRTSSAGDLVVSLHEFGHALGTKLGIHATEDMKNALGKEAKAAYDPSAWDGEAVAEFVVSYMFNRDGAIAKAGADFVSQFENMLAENKRLDKAMSNARAQVELWTNASIRSKAQAQTKSYVAHRSQVGSMLYNIVRRVETGVFDLTAPAKIVSKDFHQKALYSMHGAQRSDVLLTQAMVDPNTNETVGVGFAEALYDVGIDEGNISDVLTYQLLKHHLDRLKQDKPVFDVKEFPTEAVEAEIKKMEEENPDLAKMGGAITQWWNSFVDTWLVGTGMVSQEAVDKMREMYPNYVPTFRVMDVDMSVYGGNGGKFQIRGAVKGGSSLEVVNPLYSIVAQVQKAVKAVTQNQLLQAFDNEYLGNELGEIADDVTDKIVDQSRDVSQAMEYINQLKNSTVADPDLVDNLIKEVNALGDKFVKTGKGVGKYVVGVIRQNGEVAYYSIKDVPLFNLLSGSKATMQEGLGAFKMAKNIITSLTTGSNPLFAFKNAIRDFQTSVNTGTWAVTYADGVVKWIRAFAEVVGHSDTFKEWRSLGGGAHLRLNAALDDKSAKQLEKELGKMLLRGKTTRKGNFKISKDAMDVISNVITLKDFNNIIEMTSRFVEYRFGKHDTSTPEGKIEGMMASQDVTTNFGTHGAWGFVNLMAQITPFMNATLQGVHKDMKIVTDLFSKDKATRRQAAPKVAKIVLNSALTAGMQMAILALFKKGDTDDEEYELLSDSMKAGNFIIPIPDEVMDFLRDKFGFNKPYLRLPIAQGGLHQTTYAAALDIIGNTADYSPFDVDLMNTVATILMEAMPNTATVFQSVLDARRNKTWYNGNIENTAMQRHSEYNRTDEDVPAVINGVARLFGISPAKTDYVAQQTGGVLYRLGAPLLAGGSLDDRVDAFVTSALNYFAVDPVTTNELSSEFYAAKNIVDQTVADGNAGLPLGKIAYGADGAAAHNEAQYLQKYVFNDAKEALDDLYDRIDNIYADPDMPKGDKEKEAREIRKQMIPIYQAALDEYDPFDSEYVPSNFQLLKRLRDFSKNYSRPTVE